VEVYELDLLIPTARFVFSVEGDAVDVLPEHRSPEAFGLYRQWTAARAVVGMTTFPNTVLLRGPRTIVVDPGLHLQNAPVVRALEARGLAPGDVDQVVLTHAHLDHAGACADLLLPVTTHRHETQAAHWPVVGGVLESLPLTLLDGDEGELGPGLRWARTPGHCEGHISLCVDTVEGPQVLCGDTIGPTRAAFDAMTADGPEGPDLVASWRRIRAWRPVRVIPGHLPPFVP
jgi:glyoxylase-like metal-dependent hydrolase (beta-lactamase superfamily II)